MAPCTWFQEQVKQQDEGTDALRRPLQAAPVLVVGDSSHLAYFSPFHPPYNLWVTLPNLRDPALSSSQGKQLSKCREVSGCQLQVSVYTDGSPPFPQLEVDTGLPWPLAVVAPSPGPGADQEGERRGPSADPSRAGTSWCRESRAAGGLWVARLAGRALRSGSGPGPGCLFSPSLLWALGPGKWLEGFEGPRTWGTDRPLQPPLER